MAEGAEGQKRRSVRVMVPSWECRPAAIQTHHWRQSAFQNGGSPSLNGGEAANSQLEGGRNLGGVDGDHLIRPTCDHLHDM
jgi:hypothetical protein